MKKNYILYSLFLLCSTLQFHKTFADTINITNESSHSWSFAIYYVNDSADRATDIYTIAPGETKEVERPERKVYQTFPPQYYDREMALNRNEENLLSNFSSEQFDKLNHYNVGSKWGNTFYIVDTIEGINLVTYISKITCEIGKLLETKSELITLNNESPQSYYYAVYYVGNKGSIATSIGKIEAGESKEIERPGRKTLSMLPLLYFDRELVISSNKQDLTEELSIDQLDGSIRGNIGSKWGTSFYIIDVSKQPKVVSIYGKTIETSLDDLIIKKVPNPYRDKSAVVRYGNELYAEEALYRKKRLPKVNKALSAFLEEEINIEETPTIAVVCSGGGIRACLFTTGWLSGANQTGLLDSTTYAVGLSGSTWAINSWLTTGKDIPDFKEYMIEQTDKITTQNPTDYGRVTWSILAKRAYGQIISPVDFYGGLLGNVLLESVGENREFIGLSSQKIPLASADIPFPIYTAVGADTKTLKKWYEFTPYEVGASWLGAQGMYIPTWATGRKFWQGKSTDYSIELPMAHAMGIFGSAFSVSISEALDHVPGLLPFGGTQLQLYAEKYIQQLLSLQEESEFLVEIGNTRITTGRIHNFTKGINESPINDLNSIKLVDAGIVFNLPYPPISGQRPERKADIIIFVDASSDIIDAPSLRKTEGYACQNNLPYPEIDAQSYEKIDQQAATIIKGNNDQPTIIYMPFIRDSKLDELLTTEQYQKYNKELKEFDPKLCTEKEFCKTTNFRYKKQSNQARKVILQAEFNVRASSELIKKTIREVVQDKKRLRQ